VEPGDGTVRAMSDRSTARPAVEGAGKAGGEVVHLAVDAVRLGAAGPALVEQTVRVVDTAGVADLLRAVFDVRVDPAEEIAEVRVEPAAERGRVVVALGDGAEEEVEREGVADSVLGRLTRHRLLEVDDAAPHVHAGGVVDQQGRGIVLLGRSGGGKSTLTTHLAHAGFGLLNDEQIRLLPEAGRVAGFRRPVAIKRRGLDATPVEIAPPRSLEVGTIIVSPADLGAVWAPSGSPAMVVLLDRDPERADPPELADLSPADVVEALCANNLDLARDPDASLAAYAWFATTTTGYRLRYRSAADAVPLVRAAVCAIDPKRVERGSSSWTVHAETGEEPLEASGRTLRRSPDVVTVIVGGEVLLYLRTSRSLARLNDAAARRWAGLEDDGAGSPADRDEFWTELVEHGFVVDAGDDGRG
jgi:hypothetical protein